ncbi:DUF6090 family protein [Robertkochia solimangrovi]|uniref:DUF6090 family protein n=1 Tax=Robertkochia solimangrovi TaxID=2213046 RepID=UPI00117E6048|nr:DUF6090 family protein [Robertkochia solimangrovi]TRZ41626.1 hypothetical protein DMZ48_16590 [Robertkochia solimangrovi]
MNTFFNKIRHKMLQEGKTGKYLKYAAGEIILVVIGILIALQVNNWNENRKQQKVKRSYTSSIINDFKKDSAALQSLITQLERDSLVFNSFTQRLLSSKSNTDTIVKMFRYEFPRYIRPDYSFNNTTLVNLIGNNTVSYPDDIRESFAALIKIQKDFERTNNIFIDKYMDLLNANAYPFEDYFLDSGKSVRDSIWDHKDKLQLLADFERLSDWKLAYTQVTLNYAKGIQRFTLRLRKNLEELP